MACQRRCETAVAAKSRINDKNAVDCNLSLPKKKWLKTKERIYQSCARLAMVSRGKTKSNFKSKD